jgi:hypothetical protein
MKFRISALIAAAALLCGCVAGVPVSVVNHSQVQLTSVVVSGSGFSESISSIAAGDTATVRVRARDEAPIKVSFEVEGQRYSATSSEELVNGASAVEATVDADFTISIDTNAH